MDVSVITVTYNSAGCIGDWLASVQAQSGCESEFIAVDNASSDDTVQCLRDLCPGVRLLVNQLNSGFGRACNQAAALCQGRYVFLLNPDAQLVSPDALAHLCHALDTNQGWGMAGTRLLASDGTPKASPNFEYPGQSQTSSDFSAFPGKIAWVIGASMFIRRQVYAAIGGFDPDFFLYGEDIDFCLRLRKHGYEIGFVPEAEVRHIGAASELGADPYDSWTRRTNGIHLFWKKHYAAPDVVRLVLRDQRRARFRMQLNGFFARFQSAHSSLWSKHRRYRAIFDTSSRFLKSQ
jgi:N-acetylglucosaminyl-diphospho-decaprenol L-rhamnosyltransferase